MSLSMKQIKTIIAEQKSNWHNASISDFGSRQRCREAIENDFLSENDISDRVNDFAKDVDYDEVCELRSDAMMDVLQSFDLVNADDYDDAINGLKFSHICGGCFYNNVHIEAYILDELKYRLVRFVSKANGDREGGINTLDIFIADYDKLENDAYNKLVRFQAVNELFQ